MTLDALSGIVFIWIARYIAGFCLVSIAMWGTSIYLWGKHWQTRVRDAGAFFVAIGVLTFVLALRPAKTDSMFWPPITWFSFSMLVVLELLWLAFLIDAIVRTFRPREKPPENTPVSYYATRPKD